MHGQFDFSLLDTTPEAKCWMRSIKDESAEEYKDRMRGLWATHAMARQHMALYSSWFRKGRLSIVGPLADTATEILRVLANEGQTLHR